MAQPLITAHAACRGHAPENTLAGIRAALDLGADAIEVDVRCTRDGAPILLHDATVDRTTDGSGEISALSLRQARRLDAGAGERMPTLRETLRAVDGRALLVLEVKPAGIEEAVLADVRRARAVEWCAVHSFVGSVVERTRTLESKLPCSLLVNRARDAEDWGRLLGRALSLGAQGVSLGHDAVTPELVRRIRLRGLSCYAWTVNLRSDVRRVAAAGVDGITTDYPDRVRRWLPR